MKVENPFGALINKVSSKNSGAEKTKESGATFSQILENAQGERPQELGSTLAPGSIISQVDLNDAQKQAISRGEDTLTLLNHLAGLLERPSGRTSMESVAGALDTSSRELQALKEQLDTSDPLRKTIDQIAILSVVEKIKITRGDYT